MFLIQFQLGSSWVFLKLQHYLQISDLFSVENLSQPKYPTSLHNCTDPTEELGVDFFEPAFEVGTLI